MTFPKRVDCGLCVWNSPENWWRHRDTDLNFLQAKTRDGKDSHVKDLLFPTIKCWYDLEFRLVTSRWGWDVTLKFSHNADFPSFRDEKTWNENPTKGRKKAPLLASHTCSCHAAPLRPRCPGETPM